MKILGRSSSSNVVKLNESFKNYDAIYVSSFTKNTNLDTSMTSTSIFAFSEDINVGDNIVLLEEYIGNSWEKSFTTKNTFYTTVIGINF